MNNPQILATFPDGSQVLVTLFCAGPAIGHIFTDADVIEVARRNDEADTWGPPVVTTWVLGEEQHAKDSDERQ